MPVLEMLTTITGLIEAFAALYISYLVWRFWTVPWSGKELREHTGAPHLGGAIGAAAWQWTGNLANKIGAGDAFKKYVEQEVRTLPQRIAEVIKAFANLKAVLETAVNFDEVVSKQNWDYLANSSAGTTENKFKEHIEKNVLGTALHAADILKVPNNYIDEQFVVLEAEQNELSKIDLKEAKELRKQISSVMTLRPSIMEKIDSYKKVITNLPEQAKTVYKAANSGEDVGEKLKSEYVKLSKVHIKEFNKYETAINDAISSVNKID